MTKEERERRMREKMGRKPVNDVVLDVQKGTITMDAVIKFLEEKMKEKADGKKL